MPLSILNYPFHRLHRCHRKGTPGNSRSASEKFPGHTDIPGTRGKLRLLIKVRVELIYPCLIVEIAKTGCCMIPFMSRVLAHSKSSSIATNGKSFNGNYQTSSNALSSTSNFFHLFSSSGPSSSTPTESTAASTTSSSSSSSTGQFDGF